MRDFADIVLRNRGLALGSHPEATLFKEKYYNRFRADDMYPEFIHFSGHQENLSSILRLLGFEPAFFRKVPPGAALTFEFYEVDKEPSEFSESTSEFLLEAMLHTLDRDRKLYSESIPVLDCEDVTEGSVKAKCFFKAMNAIINDTDFNDVKEWC